jgi:hypothetical protein
LIFCYIKIIGNDKESEPREKTLNQNQNSTAQEQKKSAQYSSGNPVKNYVLEQLAKLMTTCIVIRISNFTLYQVTTSTRKAVPKEFITGNIHYTNNGHINI